MFRLRVQPLPWPKLCFNNDAYVHPSHSLCQPIVHYNSLYMLSWAPPRARILLRLILLPLARLGSASPSSNTRVTRKMGILCNPPSSRRAPRTTLGIRLLSIGIGQGGSYHQREPLQCLSLLLNLILHAESPGPYLVQYHPGGLVPPPRRTRHEENARPAAQRRRNHLALIGPRSQARDSTYLLLYRPHVPRMFTVA